MTGRRDQDAASGEIRERRPPLQPLPRAFFDRPAGVVARDLLGAWLVSEVDGLLVAGELVETEAYTGPEDEASHAAERFGRTTRNAAMFGAPGLSYVYLIYGMHWCINAVTGPEDHPAAVLLRAARPVQGMEPARLRRPGRPDRELMRGPGNLARALGIDGRHNALPMDRPPLWLAAGTPVPEDAVAVGPRIGITRAADAPLRFWVRGSPWVSKHA